MVTCNWNQLRRKGIFLILTAQMLCSNSLSAQVSYKYYYRICFRDKGNYNISSFSPSSLLSERAIARRQKAGIDVPDYNDLPVNTEYIDQVEDAGFILHCTSKWLNTGLFKTEDEADTSLLTALPFVTGVKIVKKPAGKGSFNDKLNIVTLPAEVPPYNRPISMLNGYPLHESGYNGKGIMIAVLDGGFYKADLMSSLAHLYARDGVKGTYDFVNGDEFVYDYHNHGTAVLTVLAGKYPGWIEGTAPGADYWLFRSEDTSSEFPVEEDFWAAAAEFADSIGADIISSSLGYYVFDDPLMDYSFSDMDGNSAFVTKAADMAASKGILVVASAGNERNKPWKRIIAPSDGDSVISAGAVDGYNVISSFSSAGPSADRQVKPDVVAMGVSVPVQTNELIVSRANGTSFSCPVLSGMCASVMQASPEATARDIVTALRQGADRVSSPDSLYGYGLPDMMKVLELLEDKYVKVPEKLSIAGPNPFTGIIEITFRESPEYIVMEIFNSSGKLIARQDHASYVSRSMIISEIQAAGPGMYIIRIRTANGRSVHKVIKVNR